MNLISLNIKRKMSIKIHKKHSMLLVQMYIIEFIFKYKRLIMCFMNNKINKSNIYKIIEMIFYVDILSKIIFLINVYIYKYFN